MEEVNERTEAAEDPDGEDIDIEAVVRVVCLGKKRTTWGRNRRGPLGEPHIILQTQNLQRNMRLELDGMCQ